MMGGTSTSNILVSILTDYLKQGRYDSVFIADENGLPLISIGSDNSSSEAQAAIFARIKKSIAMVGSQKGFGVIDEMVFVMTRKKKVVCRNFELKNKSLFLVVTMDSQRRYKRKTSQVVQILKSSWQ